MRPGTVHFKKNFIYPLSKITIDDFSALTRTRLAQNGYLLLVPRVCKVYYRNFFLKFESDDGEWNRPKNGSTTFGQNDIATRDNLGRW